MTLKLSSEDAFDRYEEVRVRFPELPIMQGSNKSCHNISSLNEVADLFDAYVFDAFGVLNIGEEPIAGACERIEQLRCLGKKLFVLTNASSYCFGQVVEKFDRLGFKFNQDELVSSRAVCESFFEKSDKSLVWGVVAPKSFVDSEVDFPIKVLLDDPAIYDEVDGVLLFSSECWTRERQILLRNSLTANKRPVIVANPDLVAPRETGLSVEPGYFAHDLMDAISGLDITFHGKPFPSVYNEIEKRLGPSVNRKRIVMMGDSLHTDIWGARVRGWGSVLVTEHGFLKGQDPLNAIEISGIYPDFVTPSI